MACALTGAAFRERAISDQQETGRGANTRAEKRSTTPFDDERLAVLRLPLDANVTTVRLRSGLGPQPFQQETQPLQPAQRQGQPSHCSHGSGVNAARPDTGRRAGQTGTCSHSSDSTVWCLVIAAGSGNHLFKVIHIANSGRVE